jgi:hypothetical protein
VKANEMKNNPNLAPSTLPYSPNMSKKRPPRSALLSPFDFNRQDGRQMEIEYFKSFQHLEPDIQSDNFNHGEKQIPDFLVSVNDRVVGVEVTQLFKPEGRRSVESMQERILEEACRMAQEQKLPPAHVTLFFNLFGTRDPTVHQIAKAVVSVVTKHMPADGESVSLERALGQPQVVDMININRVHRREIGRWEQIEFATVGRDVASLVDAAIAKKANKLSSYLKFCSECWLLIVADSFRPSGKLAFDDSFQSHDFVSLSPFARTYVLDFGKGKLYPLHRPEPD